MNAFRCQTNALPAAAPRDDWRIWSAITMFAVVLSNFSWAADETPKRAEEDFRSKIFIANADGSGMKPLMVAPGIKAQGSPAWSKDGKLIAFDAEIDKPGVKVRREVVVVNADGSNPRVLIDGYTPIFSPDGRHIVFSRQSPGGVWVMSSEGPEVELAQLDKNGWGCDWSVDGRIVFRLQTQGGTNLVVFDLIDGRREMLFEEPSPYQTIAHNFKWSIDGKRIVFRGLRHGVKVAEVVIVDAMGAKFGHTKLHEADVWGGFAWRPDGERLLISQMCDERKQFQLYFLDPKTTTPPELLPGQDTDRRHTEMAYSPDGKKLAISSGMRIPHAKPATDKAPATK